MSAFCGAVMAATAKMIANPMTRPSWSWLNQYATCASDQYGWGGGCACVTGKNTMKKML